MLPFDYQGRDWHAKNRVRLSFLEIFFFIFSILVFPFVLLNLFFWWLWGLGQTRRPAR